MTHPDEYLDEAIRDADRHLKGRADPQNDESSNYCMQHKQDYFGSCSKCRYEMNKGLLDGALGALELHDWLNEQQIETMLQMDSDDDYISSVTRDEK